MLLNKSCDYGLLCDASVHDEDAILCLLDEPYYFLNAISTVIWVEEKNVVQRLFTFLLFDGSFLALKDCDSPIRDAFLSLQALGLERG
jgi:hypothetical protein